MIAPCPAVVVAALALSASTCCPTTPSGGRPSRAPVPSGSTANSAGRMNMTRISPAARIAAPSATAIRFLTSVADPTGSALRTVASAFMSHHCWEEIAGQLIADQEKAARHDNAVERERVVEEAAARAPPGQRNQNRAEREALADFHADVEAHDVGDEPVRREREILQLGREAEAVEEAEDEHRQLRVRLEAEEAPEPVHVLERLVDHRKADHGVDQERIRADAAEDAREQRDAVSDR